MTLTDRLLALTGVIPPFLLLWAAERFERRVREPSQGWRYRVLVAAGAAALPATLIARGLDSLGVGLTGHPALVFDAFVVAAVVEESAKVVCLWTLTRGPLGPGTRYGAFLYALHAALGLALVENVMAMLISGDLEAFTTRFVLRAYLTIPMHMVAGGALGYLWARRRFDDGKVSLVGGWGAAVAIHGTYNALLLSIERLEASRLVLTAWASGAIAIPLVGSALLALAARGLRSDDTRTGRPPAAGT